VPSPVKNPGPKTRFWFAPERGVIGILLHVVGMLEYWSTGILGLKSELGLICDYQNTHLPYKIAGDPQPITPSLHHSIIPVAYFACIARPL
jgi:hypothetical protein